MIDRLAMKVVGGAVVVAVILGLALYAKAAVAERDLARVNYGHIEKVLETTQETLTLERAERAKVEALLADRIARQKEIEREAAARIRRKDAEIAELRRQHEEVDKYLAIPVPDALVDWLRGQGHHAD